MKRNWVRGMGAMLGAVAALGQGSVAEACPLPPSPENVRVWREAEAVAVDVATDGFLLLDVLQHDPKAALEATTVHVTNAEGEDVAGKLAVLEGYLAWEATSPLAVGSKLTAVITGSLVPGHAAVPDEVELRVAGEPTSLGAQQLAFSRWLDYAHGVGDRVQCTQLEWQRCGSGVSFLPGAEELLHAAELSWRAPDWHGYLLWEVTVEQTPEQRAVRSFPARTLIDARTKPSSDVLGTFAFPSDTNDYCATLSVRDLRTGKTEKVERCAAPERGVETLRDTDLANCNAPPTPALTEAWCSLHPESELEVCTKMGEPPVEDDEDPVVTPKPPVEDDEQAPSKPSNAADGGSKESQGCQAAPGSAGSGAALALVFALGALVRRRR